MHISQSEASECGLACLAMVAQAHRLEIDLATLRRRFPVSLKGATLKQVMATADQLGFNTRALRGEVADLAQVSLPCVLHWLLEPLRAVGARS
jgi:ATP-binding cassette, subfamily B, bacterial CvaB/MchF/RaxB